jgi:mRNA interferase MazF
MARILRGEIYWSDLNPIRGREKAQRRPLLVVSHEIYNERSGTVVALAITSQPQDAGFPLAMKIESVRLPKEAWVKTAQVRTLPAARLGRRIGHVSPEEFSRVVEGMNEIVGEG